ncbi:MAG: class I SAM-dependent methyltransferase [Bacillota bacterium]
MSPFHKVTELAHLLVSQVLQPGDRAVDATAGNGIDSIFLAGKVGSKGQVYTFDIQEEALTQTADKLKELSIDQQVFLIQDNHEKLSEYIDEPVKVFMYNLGYLPGGGSRVTTRFDTTLRSIQQALVLLKPGGIITVVMYPGHREGKVEKDGLLPVFKKLSSAEFVVMHYNYLNRSNNPPELVFIQKEFSDQG